MDERTIIITTASERAIQYVQASMPAERREIITALQHVLQEIGKCDARLSMRVHFPPINTD